MNIAHQITTAEWVEISSSQEIRDALWMHDDETADDLAGWTFGVRFDYATDCPGYAGALYLLQGGAGPEVPPLAIIRNAAGQLELVPPEV